MIWLLVLAAWFVLAVVVALVVGRVLRARDGQVWRMSAEGLASGTRVAKSGYGYVGEENR